MNRSLVSPNLESERFTADPRDVYLALESKRLSYAFMFDRLLAMSASKVDPLPHQIEAVYRYLLKQPRIRFLLGHDPGAGKTIMAGLVIKELKIRQKIKRVLIVVPGPLREQWRWEMEDKFGETFKIIERSDYNKLGKDQIWSDAQLITSLDFAKRQDILNSMQDAHFDIVIVDEAHKMSAYSTGKTTTKTMRYRLGEVLSTISPHLLFLTATPHKGDPANFRLLLDLLEPGFFAAGPMMDESIKKQDNPMFLRRTKEDMVGFDGQPLFMPRTVQTPDIELSRPERLLYKEMSAYVREQYNLALQSVKGHNITFALIILQRRFASSTYALCESLKRRKAKLQELEAGAKTAKVTGARDVAARMEQIDEMGEKERWSEEEKWEVLSLAQNTDELRQEIDTLESLIQRAKRVIGSKVESKLNQLKVMIKTLDERYPDEKILIFTESKDTLNYLVSNITSWGYTVNTIHGSMNPTVRKMAEVVFRDTTRIMVATEAAGEGINLQFCHLMINYDLPWNPNRLEQRMGRIHRYGQKKPVHVFNMVAADTREGEIMQTLFSKLEEIKNAIGSDKVFDVISDIIPGKNLAQLMLEATTSSRHQRTIVKDLQTLMDSDNQRIRNYLKDSMASKYIDHSSLQEEQDASRERQLVPDYTRNLFEDIMDWSGGEITYKDGGIASVRPPEDMMPDGPKTYPAVAFDKRSRMDHPGVDLVTFGHPLFEAALQWTQIRCSDAAMIGAVFTDWSCRLDGCIVFYESVVTDGSKKVAGQQLVACYVDQSGKAQNISPSILLDLEPGGKADLSIDIEQVRRAALTSAKGSLNQMVKDIQTDRNSQATASQKYGLKSIDDILIGISRDIEGLLIKKAKGTKVDLAIYNKRKDRRRYRTARTNLKKQITQNRTLESGAPLLVGMIRVVPRHLRPPEIEEHAMMAAMDFEKKRRRVPTITRGMGYGFDVRSVPVRHVSNAAVSHRYDSNPTTRRYIVVKATDGNAGFVVFTPNEWLRANILQDEFYLYVYTKKRFYRESIRVIQNPSANCTSSKTDFGYKVYFDIKTTP